LIVKANRLESGLKEQKSSLDCASGIVQQELFKTNQHLLTARDRVRVLEEEGKTSKEEAETRVGTLEGEMKTLKEEAETCVGTLEEEVNLKEKAETRVRTLEGEVNGLNFKCNRRGPSGTTCEYLNI
jgi:predicted  nucleic acid-binding Zn-ribbon protein